MGDRKYKAFISYSHADEAWGGWLQRSLEHFRAPGSLAAALEAKGKTARLSPVFRDREDLPVAGNLNSAIQAALADSEFQIVLCSPNAAKSRWVNEEIKLFHKLHGAGKVFALIVAGEPNATATPGREDEECFPPALRFHLDSEGNVLDAPAEPLAADAREGGDGKRYALLKVAAGILGVGLDDLVRRDATRRARQAWTITGASLAGTAATLALTVFAVVKSNEATRMRGEAEDLIKFMLTDLKDRLEPVGRLDVLEAVVARAMNYYAGQDPNSLDDDALARRAKAMMQLGTIDDRRYNFDAALAAFTEAEAATHVLLGRQPNNPERIFDHAQSAFYVGDAAIKRRDFVSGEKWYLEYLRLAQRLVDIDANNPEWRLEVAYATSNLGILKYEAGDYDAAISMFKQSIEARRIISEQAPDNEKLRFAYAYAMSWRALAEIERGEFREAINLIETQLALYGERAHPDSEDFSVLDAAVTAQHRLANSHLWLGEIDEAKSALDQAKQIADRLLARDNHNGIWVYNASYIERLRSMLMRLDDDEDAAVAAADRSIEYANQIAIDGDAAQNYRAAKGAAIANRLAFGDRSASDEEDAAELDRLLDEALLHDTFRNALFIGMGSLALAKFDRRAGRAGKAGAGLAAGIESLEENSGKLSVEVRLNLATLYLEAGQKEKAAAIITEMEGRGLRHPDFLALQADFQRFAGK